MSPTIVTHPHLQQLEAYAADGPVGSVRQEVTGHLDRGCPVCSALVLSYRAAAARRSACEEAPGGSGDDQGRAWSRPGPGPGSPGLGSRSPGGADGESYDAVFDRVFEKVRQLDLDLGRERARAAAQVERLAGQPRQRQLLMVRNAQRCRTAGVCELLLERARDLRFESPPRSLEAAELAATVAEHLEPERYGAAFIADLGAQAWCWVGNARRLTGDLSGAEEAFGEAEERLSRGCGLALDRIRYLRLRSILADDRRQLDLAQELQREALELCARDGLTHEAALQLLNRANLQAQRDDLGGEILLIRRALELLDSDREPRMAVVAIHNLANCLHDQGRHGEALALLVRWRGLYLKHADRAFLLHLHWLEGGIARELGRLDQAEGAFREARRGFLDLDMTYDAAVVTLELAVVHLQRGEAVRVRRLAAEMVPYFRSRQVHQQASAALLLFCKAAQQERATSTLVRRVKDFLEAARYDPSLRFEPGGPDGEDGGRDTPNRPATISTKPTP